MRAVNIQIIPPAMLEMIKRHSEFDTGKPFPKDIRCRAIYHDFDRDSIILRVSSQTFQDIREGESIPYVGLRLK